ncbi:probable very-long-chain (3r)-3-hydroxyacyl-coa dehydratase [Phtheirospermum japonicum]|uniref:Very-long-chain (3R)-3-hydroxyacyl-CoA dehydratase n=1 Tax=Phtheirospermum japonicum TaxID=374723 RepID=A0A830BAW3_9LAMI|nr:probable very-long-chain (3r)-3-hydroxyacyl-coa dehydratase [Phtheirospermum japonicum]
MRHNSISKSPLTPHLHSESAAVTIPLQQQSTHTRSLASLNCPEKLTLCDYPGLVFPSFTSSRYEMVASGILSIDHMTEQWEAVQVVASRVLRCHLEYRTMGMLMMMRMRMLKWSSLEIIESDESGEEDEIGSRLEHVLSDLNALILIMDWLRLRLLMSRKNWLVCHIKQHKKTQRKKDRSWRVRGSDGDWDAGGLGMGFISVQDFEHFLLHEVQELPSVFITFVAWSLSEVIRYSHYALNCIGSPPNWITFIRYNAFIVLYPIGVFPGESFAILLSIFVDETLPSLIQATTVKAW